MNNEFSAVVKKVWPSIKTNQRLVLIGLLGVALLIVGGIWDTDSSRNVKQQNTNTENVIKNQAVSTNKSYEENLEAKLANMLCQVKGAGSVSVNISFEGSSFQEHEKNVTEETKTIQEKDSGGGIRTTVESKKTNQVLLTKEGNIDKPVMVREVKPAIQGVLVIAEGAADSHVKENLVHAVQAGLGIPSYKISVLPQRR